MHPLWIKKFIDYKDMQTFTQSRDGTLPNILNQFFVCLDQCNIEAGTCPAFPERDNAPI